MNQQVVFFIHIAKEHKSYCTLASPQVVFSPHTREEKIDVAQLKPTNDFFDAHMQ